LAFPRTLSFRDIPTAKDSWVRWLHYSLRDVSPDEFLSRRRRHHHLSRRHLSRPIISGKEEDGDDGGGGEKEALLLLPARPFKLRRRRRRRSPFVPTDETCYCHREKERGFEGARASAGSLDQRRRSREREGERLSSLFFANLVLSLTDRLTDWRWSWYPSSIREFPLLKP